MRAVIITADDFGLALPVNDAIERGHREGVLTTASLMVCAPAAADAVERARRLPSLRVGLHLVLVNGQSALPPDRIPDLVDAHGRFPTNLLGAGVRYFALPGIRRQLEDEIRAQFSLFQKTGLPLDHVNAQNHFHVHPTVLSLLIRVGREFGMRAVRVPREPFWASWRATRTAGAARLANSVFLWPWLMLMQARLRDAGFATNDAVFGMNDSGRMNASVVRAFFRSLPRGVSEVYSHPATHAWPGAEPASYDFAAEFAALVDASVARALEESCAERISFTELAARGE